MAESDQEWMLRLQAGDAKDREEAFELLVAKYRDAVIHFLYRMVHKPALAEELAQEVFLRVYRARRSYKPRARFSTWLYRIATNVGLLEAERRAAIRRAVEALPEKQRLAVLLHKYQEMDYAQIAEVLDCSESALKSLLFRAYETLRERLRPLLGARA